jgi:hypothetical protein
LKNKKVRAGEQNPEERQPLDQNPEEEQSRKAGDSSQEKSNPNTIVKKLVLRAAEVNEKSVNAKLCIISKTDSIYYAWLDKEAQKSIAGYVNILFIDYYMCLVKTTWM